MLVTVVATLCLASSGACIDRVVTTEATLMQCSGAMAVQVLPAWMEEQGYTARGYRLAKWGCVVGGKREHI